MPPVDGRTVQSGDPGAAVPQTITLDTPWRSFSAVWPSRDNPREDVQSNAGENRSRDMSLVP